MNRQRCGNKAFITQRILTTLQHSFAPMPLIAPPCLRNSPASQSYPLLPPISYWVPFPSLHRKDVLIQATPLHVIVCLQDKVPHVLKHIESTRLDINTAALLAYLLQYLSFIETPPNIQFAIQLKCHPHYLPTTLFPSLPSFPPSLTHTNIIQQG